jgi:hypothetical protein
VLRQVTWEDKTGKVMDVHSVDDAVKRGIISSSQRDEAWKCRDLLVRRYSGCFRSVVVVVIIAIIVLVIHLSAVSLPSSPMHLLVVSVTLAHTILPALTPSAPRCVGVLSRQCERLAAFDDDIADAYLMSLEQPSTASLPDGLLPQDVDAALRRVSLKHVGKAVVVMCGSAYKNKVGDVRCGESWV